MATEQTPARTPLTWRELSCTKAGDRLVFVTPHDIFPECIVPEGARATVKMNELNELGALMTVLPDDRATRKALKDWDGEIQLNPHNYGVPDATDDERWDAPSPVARLSFNRFHALLLASYPNADLLPIDRNDLGAVDMTVRAHETGDTLFDFLWLEISDLGEEGLQSVLKGLDTAIRDLQAVEAHILLNPEEPKPA